MKIGDKTLAAFESIKKTQVELDEYQIEMDQYIEMLELAKKAQTKISKILNDRRYFEELKFFTDATINFSKFLKDFQRIEGAFIDSKRS